METVYMLTNTVNNKRYIGHTKQTLSKRMSHHKGDHSGCRALKAAIVMYGWDAFSLMTIEHGLSSEMAREREMELIKEYDTYGKRGYNMTPGGEITPMIFPSVVAKRLATVSTIEHRQKMAAVNARPDVKERRKQGGKRQRESESEYTKAKRMAASTAPEVVQRRAATIRCSQIFKDAQLVAQNRPETATKRKTTWAAKREAKLALLSPEESARRRARAERNAARYAANKEFHNAQIRKRRLRQRTSKSRPSCANTGECEHTCLLASSDRESYDSS